MPFLKSDPATTALERTVLDKIVKKLETNAVKPGVLNDKIEAKCPPEDEYDDDDDQTPGERPQLEVVRPSPMRPTATSFTPSTVPTLPTTQVEPEMTKTASITSALPTTDRETVPEDQTQDQSPSPAHSPTSAIATQLRSPTPALSSSLSPVVLPIAGHEASPADLAIHQRAGYEKITFLRATSDTSSELPPASEESVPRPVSPVTAFIQRKTFDDPDLEGREVAYNRAYGFGARLLRKRGWQVGEGLGPSGRGIKVPVITRAKGAHVLNGGAAQRGSNAQTPVFHNTMSNPWQKFAASNREKQVQAENERRRSYGRHGTTNTAQSSRLIDDSSQSGSSSEGGQIQSWVSSVARQNAEPQKPDNNIGCWVVTEESPPPEDRVSSGVRRTHITTLQLMPMAAPAPTADLPI